MQGALAESPLCGVLQYLRTSEAQFSLEEPVSVRQAQLLIILAVAGCSGPNYHKLPTRFRQPFSAAGRLSPKTTIPLHFVRELKVPAESLGYSMSASVAISLG